MEWMISERVLHDAAPRPMASCQMCGGAVGMNYAGQPFDRCPQCRNYGSYVDALIPITYSLDDGLESMLHRFKDRENYNWLQWPLASLLWTFMKRHMSCIRGRYGEEDVAITVPSDNSARRFNHIRSIIEGVQGAPLIAWRDDVVVRNRTVGRPRRGQVAPAAYLVQADQVARRSVLILDDTWTSGSSMVSVAAALKNAGATKVVALTLGRQLNCSSDYLNNQELVEEVRERGWGLSCVICAR
ncbi:phosphoribosyltransferase [Dactylosporangium aurantiacum]|uniref:Phosphoribosyltransferase n=1 Tax=Dactylosporangium aurantiacum TaxID=35754 RepID=A0A9Q9ME51_9ACTN|nr:phosphoribosyltransferase [Dactylosporangium aurantiacum]MDG6108816.1 phosphoribosyltransferase [Dactylosporangium aurantiacum]UWZ55778.1 phosphoribosyltransferase [Dactylosporangium aurantiacum]